MTERIEAQIERFAPGFPRPVLGRSTSTAVDEEEHNPSYVGGDINAGAATLRQMVFRPTVRWNPYRTALKGVYLCSAATPPGGGVHGMCGLGRGAGRAPRPRREPARPGPVADGRHRVLRLVPVPNDLEVGALLLPLRDPPRRRARRALHGRRRGGPQHRVVLLRLRGCVPCPPALRVRRRDQPGHRAELGLQPHAVADTVPPAARRPGGEHGGAQRRPDDPRGATSAGERWDPGRCQRQRAVLHRRPRRHHAGTDGRPSQGRRVRPRCGQCEGIRVSRGGGGSRRVDDQCAGELGESLAELDHPH